MIPELKKELLENPEHIKNILTIYNFSNIHITGKEIRCGISKENNSTSIRIKLENNKYLFVTDYGRNINLEIFSFIIKSQGADYKDVINVVKKECGMEHLYYNKKNSVFGGFYDKIKPHNSLERELKIYDESILNPYLDKYSLRFIKDNICIETQKKFNIGFDIISQRITIPIYDCYGNLIGIKGRANWEIEEDEPKYLYLINCPISETLYGYSNNYEYLTNNKILVMEAEKSVLQGYSGNIRNIVSLGGNSLSTKQCKLLMELNPTEIIFALDEGLDIEVTNKNIEKLKVFTKLHDTKIGFWNYRDSKYIEKHSKKSPIDNGTKVFKNIIENEIEYIK